jgi:nucleoid DNA-binding protein
MNIDQIFTWILNHSKNYPGKHQESQPRTVNSFKPLEPKSQLHVIFKTMSEYMKENLISGKSVNLRGFGAFSFEIASGLVEPAIFTTVDFKKDLDQQRAERKHVHKIRPCFVVDAKLKYYLARYPGKEEITSTKSQHSIYQQGFGMIFCNPGPIAAGSYLAKEVVSSAIQAFIAAVWDLTQLGHDLAIDFGFCTVKVNDKNLSYTYKQDFVSNVNDTKFEHKIKKSEVPTDGFWKTNAKDKWAKSTLSGLYKQPDASKVQTLNEKTLALKIMSLDLNTAEKTTMASGKTVSLPIIEKKK